MLDYEEELKKFMSGGNVSAMELMRFACRGDEFYSTMVSEYKRNMELLLCGIFSATPEQASQYSRCSSIGEMAQDNAEAQNDGMYEGAIAGLSEEEIAKMALSEEESAARTETTGAEDAVD